MPSVRWVKPVSCIFVLLSFLAIPIAKAEEPVEAVAAVVNDSVISTYDVRQRMMLLAISSGIQPTQEVLVRLQSEALKDLINEKLQLQEAKTFDIEVEQEEVDQALARIASRTNATTRQLALDLAKSGVDVSSLRQQLEAQIAWQRLINGLYGRRVRVGDDEVEATQNRILSSAAKESYQISEIFLQTNGPEEQQRAAEIGMRLIEEMKKGAPFPAIAQQFSSAASAARGGSLGWVLSGELEPQIEQVVASMQPGQVSMPIPAEEGIYIIALVDRKAGQNLSPSLHLKQISYDLASYDEAQVRENLLNFRSQVENCEQFETLAENYAGANATDLGSINESQLNDELRTQLSRLSPNEATEPLNAGERLAMIMLCNRSYPNSAAVPSKEEIENRLFDQQLALLSERRLRDLRSEATIITR